MEGIIFMNTNKIKEYKNDLENYNGYLPYLILFQIDSKKYYTNLKKSEDYHVIQKEFYNFRVEHKKCKDENQFLQDDLKKWCDENPEFKDII